MEAQTKDAPGTEAEEPLSFAAWCIHIVREETRPVRRAAARYGRTAYDFAMANGPVVARPLVTVYTLAWFFAIAYVCLQFFTFLLAMNPLLFWFLTPGFFFFFMFGPSFPGRARRFFAAHAMAAAA